MESLPCKLSHPDAKLPTKHYFDDAGFDLYSVEVANVPASGSAVVDIGVAIGIPAGYYGQLATRSSFGKRGLYIHPGVVDAGYTGTISVLVRNLTTEDYKILKGDKVAQLLILPVPKFQPVTVSELDYSARGANGFGSSGR